MRRKIEKNIVIAGIPEDEDEDELTTKAKDVIEKLDCSVDEIEFSRIGKATDNRPRLLKVTFTSLREKLEAVRKASRLRNDETFRGIYVNSDLTFVERKENKRLRDECASSKRENLNADVVLRRGKLYINDKLVDIAAPHHLLFRARRSAHKL